MRPLGMIIFLVGVVFFFIDWRLALLIIGIGITLGNIEKGPSFVLNMISGYMSICGIVFLFTNIKFGIGLLFTGFLITIFRINGDKSNARYYGIMSEISNQYNIEVDEDFIYQFKKGNEGEYNVKFNGKEYNVIIEDSGKFSWD